LHLYPHGQSPCSALRSFAFWLPGFGVRFLKELIRVDWRAALAALIVFLGVDCFCQGQNGIPHAAPAVIGKGVVVEWVTKNSTADKAGVRAGDVLLNWTRGEESGRIDSPFDLPFIRFEQASRGTVTIAGFRGAERQTWLLTSDTWGIAARPTLEANLLATYLEGEKLADAGKLTQAAELWRKIGARQLQPSWLCAWFLSRAAQVLFRARSWDASDASYREAIQQAAGAEPPVRAELFRQWASGFDYRDDLTQAEKNYELATLEWQKMGAETMALSESLVYLGWSLLRKGDLVRAEECLHQASEIATKLAPGSTQAVNSFANLGVSFQEEGDLAKAEMYYRKALDLEDRYFPGSSYQADTLTNLATLTYRRGDLDRAQTLYRRALAISQRLAPDTLDVAKVLAYLGECLLDAGDLKQGEEYLKRALLIRQKLSPESADVASSLGTLGKSARLHGDLTQAEKYYLEALSISEKQDPSSPKAARFLFGLATVAQQFKEFAAAENYYRRALLIMRKSSPESQEYAEILADLAGVIRQKGDPDTSSELYEQALAALETKTMRAGGLQEDKSRYRGMHDRYYREYVDLLMEQGQVDLAFQILDSSRSRTLLDSLANGNVDIHEGLDSSFATRERGLQRLLNIKSQQRTRLLASKHTEEELATIDSEMREILYHYQQLQDEVRAANPKYAGLVQPQRLSTSEIQQLLDDDTLLLEYALGDERSFVWVVAKSSIATYKLPKRQEIESAARRAYYLLRARNSEATIQGQTERQIRANWTRLDAEYSIVARELSRMILSPIATRLQQKRLLIVSDGALQYIPFAALPTPELIESNRSYVATGALQSKKPRPSSPLIVEHEVINLPSASILAELRRQQIGRQQPPKAVAVLADPVFDRADERVVKEMRTRREKDKLTPSGLLASSSSEKSVHADLLTRSADDLGLTRNGDFYLSRLLSTRQEAEAIMAVTPAGERMKAIDFQASREVAISGALARYRIVHFATHGFLDNKHPEFSGLVLSLVNKQGRPQNGFLDLQDIYNLSLPVELVVLSACETGLGQEISGEGLIGLTRGFMYAGATRVVASLWSVSDEATAELMARFYRFMEVNRMRPAAALRAAQVEMWKQNRWSSPYYWAAFQIQGEWK